MSAGTPGDAPAHPPAPVPAASERRGSAAWWWAHAGRISGTVLGLFVLALLVLLAVAGYTPAGVLLALLAGGLLMIIIGGRIHRR